MNSKTGEAIIKRHIIRYGIAPDQKYLVGDFLTTYDQLVINASMVAHMPGALTSFIMQRTRYKSFFIDPQTHAFQHDISHLQSSSLNSKGKLKKSIKSLLESYGDPVRHVVANEGRLIIPEDFNDKRVSEDFCERVIDFQLEALAKQTESADVAKYYKFLKKKGEVNSIHVNPDFVITPYFCMQSNNFEKWIDVNINCAKISQNIAVKKGIPWAVQIVTTKDVLIDREQVGLMIDKYSELSPNVFLIWIDDFSEHQCSESALTAFANFLKRLSKIAPVANLYAGYFSVLLVHLGILAGATHSLEYGETRPVVPVGGGIPVSKYYLPTIHKRLAFRTALRAVRALGGMEGVHSFYEAVCNCPQCKKIIQNNPDIDFALYGETKIKHGRQYPLPQTKDNSVRHYMWCKAKEYQQGLNLADVLKNLEKTADLLVREIGTENTGHCKIWAKVLSRMVV